MESPRLSRRLVSLPARIVLFVCAATLVTAGLVGGVALYQARASVEAHLDQTSREALANAAVGDGARRIRGSELGWQGATLLPDGTLRPAVATTRGWSLPPGWPSEGLESPTARVIHGDANGDIWVLRGQRNGDASHWLLVRRPFEEAYAPFLSLLPVVFILGSAAVFVFCWIAYWLTASVVHPIELLAAEARRISQGDLHTELSLPARSDEVGLLARTFNDMVGRLRRNQQQIEDANLRLTDQNQQLQRANEILAQLSITDGLTRLHNHRFFQDQLAREIKRCERTGDPLAMILADIDDFKQLNDRFGHATGDEVLVRIAGVMNEAIRESDFLARYGGEEFAILTTGTDIEGAETLAEKIRLRIANERWQPADHETKTIGVTVSMGIALFRGDRRAFFRDADRALYLAKDMGKNCVVVDEESLRYATQPAPRPAPGAPEKVS